MTEEYTELEKALLEEIRILDEEISRLRNLYLAAIKPEEESE